MMLVSTLSRPRWAMPMTISSTPWLEAWEMTASSAGMTLSDPSREKRLAPAYFTSRKRSNPSASCRWRRISVFSPRESDCRLRSPSIIRCTQAFRSGCWMCMNSTPMRAQ